MNFKENHLFWWLSSSCKFFERLLHIDLTSAFLLDRIEMTWRIIMIVIFASSRLELIETFAKIVAITLSNWRLLSRQIDDCFSLSLSDLLWFDRLSCLLRFRWYYDQKLLLCFERRSSRERSSRIELSKISAFKSALRRRLKDSRIEKLLWHLLSASILNSNLCVSRVKFCLFFSMRSKNSDLLRFLVLVTYTISRISSTFLDVARCS